MICRSGDRPAAATEALAKDGYTNVWILVEGFEDDKDSAGKRAVYGLPWTYQLKPSQAWVPAKGADFYCFAASF